MQLFEYVRTEWEVLKGAPFSFVGLTVISFLLGLGVAGWHYAERIDTKDGEIHRYRVALGIDQASKGALVELSNQELALKAQSIVHKLRDLRDAWLRRLGPSFKARREGRISDKEFIDEQLEEMKQATTQFDRELATDAFNVDDELRRRLDPNVTVHVTKVPMMLGPDGKTHVLVPAIVRGQATYDTVWIGVLADEIEQLSALLPTK